MWNSALNLVVIAVHFLFNNLSHLYRKPSVQICCSIVICFMRMRARVSESINKDLKETEIMWCFIDPYTCPQGGQRSASETYGICTAPELFYTTLTSGAPCLYTEIGGQRALCSRRLELLYPSYGRATGGDCISDPWCCCWCSQKDHDPNLKWLHTSGIVGGICKDCCTSCRPVLNCVVWLSLILIPWIVGDISISKVYLDLSVCLSVWAKYT